MDRFGQYSSGGEGGSESKMTIRESLKTSLLAIFNTIREKQRAISNELENPTNARKKRTLDTLEQKIVRLYKGFKDCSFSSLTNIEKLKNQIAVIENEVNEAINTMEISDSLTERIQDLTTRLQSQHNGENNQN